MPRPSLLTPKVQQAIVQAIALGATYKLAAAYGGISEDTFNNWMKRGVEEEDGIYVDFRAAVEEAEGIAAVGWLAKIEKAANDGTWQAAAWKLERRYPQQYGRQSLEMVGKDGENLNAPVVRIYMPQKDALYFDEPSAESPPIDDEQPAADSSLSG
jgi:hypothetical protein